MWASGRVFSMEFGMVIKWNDVWALEIMPDLDSYDLTLLTWEKGEGGGVELQPVYPAVKIPWDNDHPKTFKEMFAYTFNKYVNDLRKSNPQSADRVWRTVNPEYHNKK